MLTRHVHNHIVWCVLNLTAWISACKMTYGDDRQALVNFWSTIAIPEMLLKPTNYARPQGMMRCICSSISHNLIQFSMGKHITMATGFHLSLLRHMEGLGAHWSANKDKDDAHSRTPRLVHNFAFPDPSPPPPLCFLGRHDVIHMIQRARPFPLCFCMLQAIKSWMVGRT